MIYPSPTDNMNKDLTVSVTKTNAVVKICSQISLLVWKRYRETTKTKWDLMKILVPVILFYVLMILVYELFSFFSGGAIEPFFVPFAYWIFVQRMVVQITYEKSARLQESMRMMGLSDVAYWTSYMVSDGIIVGFATAFLSCILSTGGLYNSADFGTILGFLFAFFLAVVPFSCFISAFFDTPQTAGQASLALLMGKPH